MRGLSNDRCPVGFLLAQAQQRAPSLTGRPVQEGLPPRDLTSYNAAISCCERSSAWEARCFPARRHEPQNRIAVKEGREGSM